MPANHESKSNMGHILIVDDEIPNLKLLAEYLGQAGYQARPAERPQLAIDSALAKPPVLILLDVKMPEMDGFEVCKRLKQDERTRDIPIIFISAQQDVQDRVRGFEAGGVDFISKPFQKEEVLARVRTHLELRNMQLQFEEMVAKGTAEVIDREQLFRAIFEQAAVGIAHISPEGRFLRINKKFCDIVGYSQEEMIALTFQDITHPDDLDVDLEYVRQMLNGEIETYSMDKRYYRKDGSTVWVNLTVSLLFDRGSSPNYFVSVIKDISDRKQAEEALRKSRDFLEHLTSAVPDAIFSIKMPERTIIWVNDSFNVMGYEPEEYVGQTVEKYYANPEDYELVGNLQQDAIRKGDDMIRSEVMALRKDGRVIPVELTATFYREKGKVDLITAMVRDISGRKQAEQKIIDYQQRLKALASQLTIAEEKERRAIAADLHDHVGQSLALARMQLASARKSTSDSKLADKLDDISDTLLKSIEDVQKFMLELSSPAMHQIGLASAISEWLEVQIEGRHGLKAEFIDNVSENRRKTLDLKVRTILFRNLRELVVNVLKHARANKVSVRLEDRKTSIRIIVEDDGIGFEPRTVTQGGSETGGFGLFSIEELMADLGGSLRIVSEPGKGCTAILSAPIGDSDSQKRK
ncbi:MAG: PAS domain S-box protein [Syntrophobacterales bacterium]|jgi:PAS domain S-box-containing protein